MQQLLLQPLDMRHAPSRAELPHRAALQLLGHTQTRPCTAHPHTITSRYQAFTVFKTQQGLRESSQQSTGPCVSTLAGAQSRSIMQWTLQNTPEARYISLHFSSTYGIFTGITEGVAVRKNLIQ
jgi:hypothetical protein